MSRTALAVVAGVLGVGIVVAMVRGQDATTNQEPGLVPAGSTPLAPIEPTPVVPREGEFVPQDPAPVRSIRMSAFDSPTDAPSDSTAGGAPIKRPTAAERLRQLREGANRSGAGAASSRSGASVIGPVTSNPAELTPQRVSESADEHTLIAPPDGNEPDEDNNAGENETRSVLKKLDSGPTSDRTTARRLLRTPSKSYQATTNPSSNSASSTTSNTIYPSRRGADAVTLSTSQAPNLRVETTGPSALLIGKEAAYTVSLHNQGETAANDILLRVTLPNSARVSADGSVAEAAGANESGQRLVWSVPRINPRSSQSFNLRVTATENRPIDLLVDWTTRPISAAAQIAVQQPQLELSVFGPQDILYGETVIYTVRLSNPGTGDAEDVTVEFGYGDLRLDPKHLHTLAAGQQVELKVELNARQAGAIQVLALATGAGGLRVDAHQEVQVRRAKLEIELTGEPVKFAGSPVAYRATVRNTGDAPATNVVAVIAAPKGAQLQADGDGVKIISEGLQVNLGTLAPKAERTVDLQCVLSAPGENQIVARTVGSNELEASDSFTTHVEALADLKLSVNDPSRPVAVGKEAIYELHIANRGTKAATKINMVAQFSQGIEPVEALGAPAEIVTGQVLFQPIPRIEPGQELTLIVKAKADSEGNKRFRAELTSEESDTQLVAQETTYFYLETATK